MFYKIKKINDLSILFQTSLFNYYNKITPPPTMPLYNSLNNLLKNLVLIMTFLLSLALIHTVFFIYLYVLVWKFIPGTVGDFTYSFRPLTMQDWFNLISLFSFFYSINLLLNFPQKFRVSLFVEQGITFTSFLKQLKKQQKINFLLCIVFFFFSFYFPKISCYLLLCLPIFIEYYCLSALIQTNLQKPIITYGNNFTTLLGLEYINVHDKALMQAQELTTLVDSEDLFFDENIASLYAVPHEADTGEYSVNSMLKDLNSRFISDLDSQEQDIEDFDLAITETATTGQTNSQKERWKIKKQLYLKNNIPFFLAYEYTPQQIKEFFQKSRIKMFLPISSKMSSFNALHSEGIAHFDELEVLSDYYAEQLSDELEQHLIRSEVSGDDEHALDDRFTDHDLEHSLYHQTNLELGSNEIGFGDDFLAPKWFKILLLYQTFPLWCFLNILLSFFVLVYGIPNDWLVSTHFISSTVSVPAIEAQFLVQDFYRTNIDWLNVTLPNGFKRSDYLINTGYIIIHPYDYYNIKFEDHIDEDGRPGLHYTRDFLNLRLLLYKHAWIQTADAKLYEGIHNWGKKKTNINYFAAFSDSRIILLIKEKLLFIFSVETREKILSRLFRISKLYWKFAAYPNESYHLKIFLPNENLSGHFPRNFELEKKKVLKIHNFLVSFEKYQQIINEKKK